ncbi:MAG: hypothetical protein F6K28_49580 [Microcoleus sp. SIO2G3]|nr:hypothetical protein [Microcoleus sp. SIO2G3]
MTGDTWEKLMGNLKNAIQGWLEVSDRAEVLTVKPWAIALTAASIEHSLEHRSLLWILTGRTEQVLQGFSVR